MEQADDLILKNCTGKGKAVPVHKSLEKDDHSIYTPT